MFYLIIILIAAIIVLRTPKGKGALGEFKVNRTAKKYGVLFKNYIIKDDMDFTHQIDTILVSSKGVFVIETKNYAGRIYGDDNSREWTQVLNYGKVKNRFYSPVKQNESHCYQVSKILPRNTQIYSYVVFTSNNTENIKSNSTIRLKDFNKIMSYYGDVLDEKQILNIVTLLEENRDTETSNRQHVKNIKLQQDLIENNICPRCGGNLVLRHGKNGDFYGCENYPECKFTKKEN